MGQNVSKIKADLKTGKKLRPNSSILSWQMHSKAHLLLHLQLKDFFLDHSGQDNNVITISAYV